MSKLLEQRPAVVVDVMVLQNKQLADVPGGDVTGHLHCPAGVVLIVHFDYLQRHDAKIAFTNKWCGKEQFKQYTYLSIFSQSSVHNTALTCANTHRTLSWQHATVNAQLEGFFFPLKLCVVA